MEYVELFMIALASASVSFTISTTSIFEWVRGKLSLIHPKVEQLIHCPWCLSHYVTLFFMFIFMKDLVATIDYWVYFMLVWFAIQGVIGVLHHIYLRAYEPVIKSEARRLMMKKQQE